MFCGALKMPQPYDCGKKMLQDGQNHFKKGFESYSFHPIWGIEELKASEKERFISSKISKYIEFWKLEMLKDDLYAKFMGPHMKYCESILELL